MLWIGSSRSPQAADCESIVTVFRQQLCDEATADEDFSGFDDNKDWCWIFLRGLHGLGGRIGATFGSVWKTAHQPRNGGSPSLTRRDLAAVTRSYYNSFIECSIFICITTRSLDDKYLVWYYWNGYGIITFLYRSEPRKEELVCHSDRLFNYSCSSIFQLF